VLQKLLEPKYRQVALWTPPPFLKEAVRQNVYRVLAKAPFKRPVTVSGFDDSVAKPSYQFSSKFDTRRH
jgi:hypothetical protein